MAVVTQRICDNCTDNIDLDDGTCTWRNCASNEDDSVDFCEECVTEAVRTYYAGIINDVKKGKV